MNEYEFTESNRLPVTDFESQWSKYVEVYCKRGKRKWEDLSDANIYKKNKF